mmetsp:Transcript_7651/g.10741  ORF Transcript_7651/g.10741 Transcript_7651/m.10741 type:complete len:120 (+) Transcript_7651:343-702(+)
MMCSPQAPSEEIKMVEKAQTGDEADSEEESQAVKEPSVECDQGQGSLLTILLFSFLFSSACFPSLAFPILPSRYPLITCVARDIAQDQYARYTHSKLRQKDKQQECGDEKRHFVRHLSS